MFKPILFNKEMVNKILFGNKTQTRRIIKNNLTYSSVNVHRMDDGTFGFVRAEGYSYVDYNTFIKPPFEQGDVLYVREAFAPSWTGYQIRYNEQLQVYKDPKYIYRADGEMIKGIDYSTIKWTPSIHMPKIASRIFLKVTDVRVERLCKIPKEDLLKEGFALDKENLDEKLCQHCPLPESSQGVHCYGGNPVMCEGLRCKEAYDNYLDSCIDDFADFWDFSTPKINDEHVWDFNPYVWVISFEKTESQYEK